MAVPVAPEEVVLDVAPLRTPLPPDGAVFAADAAPELRAFGGEEEGDWPEAAEGFGDPVEPADDAPVGAAVGDVADFDDGTAAGFPLVVKLGTALPTVLAPASDDTNPSPLPGEWKPDAAVGPIEAPIPAEVAARLTEAGAAAPPKVPAEDEDGGDEAAPAVDAEAGGEETTAEDDWAAAAFDRSDLPVASGPEDEYFTSVRAPDPPRAVLGLAAGAEREVDASWEGPASSLPVCFLSPSVTVSIFSALRSRVWPRVLSGLDRLGRLVIASAPFLPARA